MTALADQFWRFAKNVTIPSKDQGPIPLIPFGTQRFVIDEILRAIDLGQRHILICKPRQVGMCLAPDARVLTADLRWVAIDALKAGDRVVSVDVQGPGGKGRRRRLRAAEVLAVVRQFDEAWRLSFDDGTSVVATRRHPWLSRPARSRAPLTWRPVAQLRVGYRIRRLVRPWAENDPRAWGWLGGLIDGEGSLRPATRAGAELTISQAPGAVWDRLLVVLDAAAVRYRVEVDRRPPGASSKWRGIVNRAVLHAIPDLLRIWGLARPVRWPDFWWEGKALPITDPWARIVAIEPCGRQAVVDLQTSTGTYIAEGLVSHNTTVLAAFDAFWLLAHRGMQGTFIANNDENLSYFRDVLSEIVKGLPRKYSYPVRLANRVQLAWDNGSRLLYQSAGAKSHGKLGRGRGLNFLHGCLAPGTPVLVEDGRIRAVEEVRIGDRVLTHTGARALVVDAVGQRNTTGRLLRIRPWLGEPIHVTREHTIPTERGVIEAQALRRDDWLVMPRRPIIAARSSMTLHAPRRGDPGSVDSIGHGTTVALTEEFGYAVGYYLAEGSLLRQWTTRAPSGVTFAHHRDESASADRALAALTGLVGPPRRVDRRGTLTTTTTVYGTALARWLEDTVGSTDDKRIPDDVFFWGIPFCRGLLTGLLCGDGSTSLAWAQAYGAQKMVLPTTRSSIAMQARDLAASLGYGWASCRYQEGGQRSGRHCAPHWRVVWHGVAARELRKLIGLPPGPGDRAQTKKYRLEDHAVLIKVRAIDDGGACDEVWDLTVDHADHTFRTPAMAVGNTEVAYWGDPEGIKALRAALSEEHPHACYVWESTANGHNHFYDMWQEATRPSNVTAHAIFVPWWRHEHYRIDPDTSERAAKIWRVYWDGELTVDERAWQREVTARWGVTITPEQWCWWRWYLSERAGNDPVAMHQDYPTLPEHAFQASGQSFVGAAILARLRMSLADAPPARWYRYQFGPTPEATDIHETNEGMGDLTVWEAPAVERSAYVVAADPSYGANASSDRCVVQVWKASRTKLTQVAEFCSSEPSMAQFAWVCCHMAGVYQPAFFVLEINGPGIGVVQELQRMQSYGWGTGARANILSVFAGVQQYLYRRADAMRGIGAWHWRTTGHTKPPMMNRLRSCLMNDMLTIRSLDFVEECAAVRQTGHEFGATGRAHDDRVLTAAIAVEAWSEQAMPTLSMMPLDLDGEKPPGPDTVHQAMIQTFFKMRLRGGMS